MHPRQQSAAAWRRIRQEDAARRLDAAHRLPSRWAGGSGRLRAVIIGSSNREIFSTSTFFGIKRPAAPVTEVPVAVPVNAPPPIGLYADGICYGQDLQSGAPLWLGIYVQDTVPVLASLAQRLPAGLPILVRDAVMLPVTGTGGSVRVPVWLPHAF